MRTLRELYCEKHHCPATDFERRAFWRCLYPHARFFAPLILLLYRDFFVSDRMLLRSIAEAVHMQRVRDEVRDFFWDSNNRGWLRHAIRIRVSGQRVKDLARDFLPEGGSRLPFPPTAAVGSDSATSA